MSRRKPNSYADVQYSRIGDNTDGLTEEQFKTPCIPIRVPWRAIGLAFLLCFLGFSMLTGGFLILSGHIIDSKYRDRMWPFIILGALMFIPGVYHVRIAYYAYKKVPGYSFEDIPEFD